MDELLQAEGECAVFQVVAISNPGRKPARGYQNRIFFVGIFRIQEAKRVRTLGSERLIQKCSRVCGGVPARYPFHGTNEGIVRAPREDLLRLPSRRDRGCPPLARLKQHEKQHERSKRVENAGHQSIHCSSKSAEPKHPQKFTFRWTEGQRKGFSWGLAGCRPGRNRLTSPFWKRKKPASEMETGLGAYRAVGNQRCSVNFRRLISNPLAAWRAMIS